MAVAYFKLDRVCTGQMTREQLINRIAQIDALIDSLFTTAMTAVTNGDVMEYELDTGQTRTKVKYNDPSKVMAAIKMYEIQRQYYANKLTNRVTKLVDSRNFKRLI